MGSPHNWFICLIEMMLITKSVDVCQSVTVYWANVLTHLVDRLANKKDFAFFFFFYILFSKTKLLRKFNWISNERKDVYSFFSSTPETQNDLTRLRSWKPSISRFVRVWNGQWILSSRKKIDIWYRQDVNLYFIFQIEFDRIFTR